MVRWNVHRFRTIRTLALVGLLAIGLAATTTAPAFAGTWTATGSMSTARLKHTATLLPNSQVLVAGGVNSTGFITSAELYDPTTGKWTSTGSMTTARGDRTATLLPNGDVLVAGGLTNGNSSIGTACTATAELYDPSTGQWTTTGSMTTPRANHTATLLNDGTSGGSAAAFGPSGCGRSDCAAKARGARASQSETGRCATPGCS